MTKPLNILITNDDGPLDNNVSQYIRPFVQYITKHRPNWNLVIVVPNIQRSWIGKAHFADKELTATFIYSDPNSTDNKFLGPFNRPQVGNSKFKFKPNISGSKDSEKIPQNSIEWCLLDGTPASCADIGCNHVSNIEHFDLVISGPNVGRNTSRPYATSSGTVGAAFEACITGNTRAIALSWAYYNTQITVDEESFETVSRLSCDVIESLLKSWDYENKVDVYSVNVPLYPGIRYEDTKAVFAPLAQNSWTSVFTNYEEEDDNDENDNGGAIKFKWDPDYTFSRNTVLNSEGINDGKLVESKMCTITPLRASFHVSLNDEHFGKELIYHSLLDTTSSSDVAVLTINPKEYIAEPLTVSIKKYLPTLPIIKAESIEPFFDKFTRIFQYGEYEQIDASKLHSGVLHYFANTFIYRKALIRKQYLTQTINTFTAKNPTSILKTAYMESFNIDVDYAEFLDDALDEAWELRQELEDPKNNKWWILKPSMSDKAQGIRVFKTVRDLQAIFDSFDEEEIEGENTSENKIITSQLRHFIVQEYLQAPLLLNNRKFHIRCYIIAKGCLKVMVYERMLALFASTEFKNLSVDNYNVLSAEDLSCHLTNTCLQETDKVKEIDPVREFDTLDEISAENKENIKQQIREIAHDTFLAAVNANRLNFQPLENAFEIYGVDFLVDRDYKVKLLEVNAYPDFKQTGDALKNLIFELFDNVTQTCIAPIFQKKEDEDIVGDIKLNNFTTVLDESIHDW
ncbi:related to Probable tubulin--tyrosine ligase PBY1 [Saccharomycodes ludwigii]|uniref:Related to Probable tubulin--tyrosine ligase PBY1 n=1 Tax=Saccharomycodes ludwigii TaxID=36035 RepID=A0A376B662_9ASCO|nr:related to Probable tubulin--tyrosine ligase PBY1 [Saccharomycodes ludwigii]